MIELTALSVAILAITTWIVAFVGCVETIRSKAFAEFIICVCIFVVSGEIFLKYLLTY